MSKTLASIKTNTLSTIVNDPTRGTISLVGDNGGLSLITGSIAPSGLIPGTIAIETEHGTIYLDAESQITISEESPSKLSPNEARDTSWLISWKIDGSLDTPSTPIEEAAHVWQEMFGRSCTNIDDACVFTVTDQLTGEEVTLDLAVEPNAPATSDDTSTRHNNSPHTTVVPAHHIIVSFDVVTHSEELDVIGGISTSTTITKPIIIGHNLDNEEIVQLYFTATEGDLGEGDIISNLTRTFETLGYHLAMKRLANPVPELILHDTATPITETKEN